MATCATRIGPETLIYCMEIIIPVVVALLASLLTFFSGFGLGTLLLPAFALFFPAEVAIMLTAIVHLLNNLFKTSLIGRHAHWRTLLWFGIPAGLAADLGAYTLAQIAGGEALLSYELAGKQFSVLPINLVIATLMLCFALLELSPKAGKLQFTPRWLPLGGILSGFFGGLSGHQGALRSMFLLKVGLNKEAFIATGIIIALIIDLSRISQYLREEHAWFDASLWPMLLATVLAAFAGAIAGRQLLKKITIATLQRIVATLIIILALLMAAGIL